MILILVISDSGKISLVICMESQDTFNFFLVARLAQKTQLIHLANISVIDKVLNIYAVNSFQHAVLVRAYTD
jgi:hypothetical protein